MNNEQSRESQPLYHNGHLRTAGKEYLAHLQERIEAEYDRELGRVVNITHETSKNNSDGNTLAELVSTTTD